MRFEYPYTLTKDEEGFWLAKCPDIRGAATDDKDPAVAVVELRDALVAALGAYIEDDLDLPSPSTPSNPGQTIALEPLHAAKLALYMAKRRHGITNTEMSRRLGNIGENSVRRMLDLDHKSHIGAIQNALKTLGRRLVIEEVPDEQRVYA